MSKKPSLSNSTKLKSIRYRINSNATQSNNISLTIDRSHRQRQTPHFFFDSRINIHRMNSVRFNKSKTCRKPISMDIEYGGQNRLEMNTINTIDSKIDTARTLETFMDREGNEAWKNKSRIKLPLIDSNPEISFIPVPTEVHFLEYQVQSCKEEVKRSKVLFNNLKEEVNNLTRYQTEMNKFKDQFLSKCQGLKKSLIENRLKHFQYIGIVKDKMQKQQREMGQLQRSLDQTVQKAKQVQNTIFDATFEVELEPQYAPEL